MKKFLSVILALLMAVSCASAIFADDAAITDTAEETTAYAKAIDFLSKYGIYKGGDAAENDIKRYQMALFVARISTGWVNDSDWEDGPENWSKFNDLNEEPASKYLGALSYANEKGIIEGYGDGRFDPNGGITYQNALTMVVRTLGYQGLEWPWGYIEKAVGLGLTDGITGVAYVDVLTRAEVAQIIYNAMFADTRDGGNLANKSFGLNLEWRNVVISATDCAWIFGDGGRTTIYDADNFAFDERVIELTPIEEVGVFTDERYYVKPSMLGFADFGHEDEDAIGAAYKVLFNANEKDEYIDIIDYESLYDSTLWALGDTDDKGEAINPKVVREFITSSDQANDMRDTITLEGYILARDRYTGWKTFKNDIAYFTAMANGKSAVASTNGDYIYTVEIATGNIMKWDGEDGAWKVLWYYEPKTDTYFQYRVNGGKLLAHYMTDAEREELIEVFNDKTGITAGSSGKQGFAVGVQKSNIWGNREKSIYSSVDFYNIGDRQYGIFREYGFGFFANGTAKCTCAECKHDDVESTERATYKLYTINPYGQGKTLVYENFVEGVCKGHNNYKDAASNLTNSKSAFAWINPKYTPVAGEKNGTYKDGYCIFAFDMFSGEIRVIKNIKWLADKTDADDVDTYISQGTLRAYNLDANKVQIDDQVFSIQTGNLGGLAIPGATSGNIAYDFNKNNTNRSFGTNENNTYFRSLYNQYVMYVVVDGYLVDIEPVGKVTNNLLVVESYAGLSADGYIVINAYSTADLTLKQYRIASYDGWRNGDYRYYPSDARTEAYFTKGAILTVSSYIESEKAYNVETVGKFSKDENGESVYNVTGLKTTYTDISFKKPTGEVDEETGEEKLVYDPAKLCEDGRIIVNGDVRKMTADDKYILITPPQNTSYASISVYEGIVYDSTWAVKGNRLAGTDSNVFIFVDAIATNGFASNGYKTESVVVIKNAQYAPTMEFDGWGFGEDNNQYLLGSSRYSVLAFDLITGREVVLKNQYNVDAIEGHIYSTFDGNLIAEVGNNSKAEAVAQIFTLFNDTNKDSARYYTGIFEAGSSFSNIKTEVKDIMEEQKSYEPVYDTNPDGSKKFDSQGNPVIIGYKEVVKNVKVGEKEIKTEQGRVVTADLIGLQIAADYQTSNYYWKDLVKSVRVIDLAKAVSKDGGSYAFNDAIKPGTKILVYVFNPETAEAVVYVSNK